MDVFSLISIFFVSIFTFYMFTILRRAIEIIRGDYSDTDNE